MNAIRSSVCVLTLLLLAPIAGAQSWSWPEQPQNLKVLPENFTGQQLAPVMRGFSRALGVRCTHCHVGVEGAPLSEIDFVSDDNPNKERARLMLEMLGDINETLKQLEPSGAQRVNVWCHTCHAGRSRPMTLQEELDEVYHAEGHVAALEHYDALERRYYGRGAYDFSEGALNALGYVALGEGDLTGAVAIFLRNTGEHPESANAWDSLGEGHMKAGDRERAIECYRRSLELNPTNANAIEMLREMGAGQR